MVILYYRGRLIRLKTLKSTDIFSENCFIGFNGALKIGDFGFARIMEEDELSRTFCGSTVYAAPEILAASDEYNAFYSDVWSCGIILYAMLTAKAGFQFDNFSLACYCLFFKSTILMVKLLPK